MTGRSKRERFLLVILAVVTAGSLGFLAGYGMDSLISATVVGEEEAEVEEARKAQEEYLSLARFNTIPPEFASVRVEELIHVRQESDVPRLRGALIHQVWGTEGFPDRLPDRIEEGHEDERFAGLPVRRIDRLTVEMAHGVDSVVYRFHPVGAPNGVAVLYHEGHGGDFLNGKATIAGLLDRGYTVFALSMPLFGLNSQPTIEMPSWGPLKLTKHHQLFFLDRPLSFFLEPVVRVANQIESEGSFERIYMTGISGGGWTTTVAAAIDPRIRKSYPVAGSLPIFLRSGSRPDWGDFEETYKPFFSLANYLDLYVMGSSGAGRRQLQVLNRYDPCCFTGILYRLYETQVQRAVEAIGDGAFAVFSDDSHMRHEISPVALERILADMARE
jgi:hypothetical protein